MDVVPQIRQHADRRARTGPVKDVVINVKIDHASDALRVTERSPPVSRTDAARLRRAAPHRGPLHGASVPGQTLQATALVNEAFVRLAAERTREFQNRTHFLAIAALSMRQILVQRARARRGQARRRPQVTLDDANWPRPPAVGGVRAGLSRPIRHAMSSRSTRRSAAGPIDPEQPSRRAALLRRPHRRGDAEAIGISPATVKRQWAMARAWLKRALDGDVAATTGPS